MCYARGVKIRVLSWNIHKGFTAFNGEFVLNAIRKLIRSSHADLVFLQEVQGEHQVHQKKVEAWPENPQFEFLADEVWHHYAYGRNAVYTEGHHGNAILSKFPIKLSENIDLTLHSLEQRGLLHVRIQVPDTPTEFDAYCTHLNLLPSDRRTQSQRIEKEIRARSPHHAVLLAGDFNDWRDELEPIFEGDLGLIEAFRKDQGRLARTFPAVFPVLRLDRVYARGWNIVKTERLDPPAGSRLSDHLPLLAEFELSESRDRNSGDDATAAAAPKRRGRKTK